MAIPKYLPIDELRRIPILEIYHRYIGGHLRQCGRAFWSRCPWHGDDSTPSLKIYPDQNSWWCYGCQAGGSQLDMVMKALSIDFKTAASQLCRDYGINNALPDRESKKRYEAAKKTKTVNEMFEQDFKYIFVTLANINRSLIDLSRDIQVCMRYPDIFMYQLIIDDLLENMSSGSQAEQISAWRRAKKVFPWLKI